MRVVFVHGACVRDGGWWWRRTAAVLEGRGVASVAPLLPSCGEGRTPTSGAVPGLQEDVEAVRAALAASDEPTLLVGHSYGGIVSAAAAVGVASVHHMVFVSSYLPEPGESLSTFGSERPPAFLDLDPHGGTFGIDADLFEETFMHDCSPGDVHGGADRLVRQPLHVLQQPVGAVAWRGLATTYLVCTEDRGTPVSAQRAFSRRAGSVVELAAGHHPFLSQPGAVADIVLGLR